MKNADEIRQELIAGFKFTKPDATIIDLMVDDRPIALAPYFEDYVRIGAFLSNGGSAEFKRALQQLEDKVVDEIKGFYNFFSSRGTTITNAVGYFDKKKAAYESNTPQPVKDSNYSKLLSGALVKFENSRGFLATAKLPNYAGFVFGNVFKEGLQRKQHWKDVGAGENHGESTHRIQWFALIMENCIRDVAPMQEATVFQSIAPWQKGKTNLWTFLFDRLKTDATISGDAMDFRSPENLNMWLVGDADPDFCPVLRGFLRVRMSKRKSYKLATYLAKKTGLSEDAAVAMVQSTPGDNGELLRPSARVVYQQGKGVISPYAG